MKIANIIYENELINHSKVDYINYINKSMKYDDIDKSLPTLYVGWSFMKSCNLDDVIIQNANILEKRIITNQLYWECDFSEDKSSHINGIESFVKEAPDLYFSPKYSYINLDPIFFQIKDVDDLLDIIPKSLTSVYLYKDEILYILANDSKFEEKIWGINLDTYQYFQFNIDEIIGRINERSNKVINDSNGELYVNNNKQFPDFIRLKRYLVTIL